MTPKERVIAALEHRQPDRVPTGEIGIDFPTTERVLGRKTLYRAKWTTYMALWEGRRDEYVESCKRDIVDLIKALELDYVPVFLVPRKGYAPGMPEFVEEYTWREKNGAVMKFSPESGGHAIAISHPEVSLDDIVVPEKTEVEDSQLELVRHIIKELGETHFILGRGADGTYPCTGGITNFLMKMITEPEFVRKAIQARTKRAIAVGQVLIEEGCDGILMGSDYAYVSGPMMSPEHFKKFIYPALKEHCDQFHRAGAFVIKHTDGNTWQILDMMLDAGIDGYQAIELNAGMDIKRLKEKYGGRLCLFGGVDCATLVAGSAEDVREEVRYAIKYGAPGGGLVITSGNTIMAGVKYENYMAMLDEVRKSGQYPIRL
ncbi:MAG: hypothetical protein AMS15_00260 [Planctomycetes bacterium DG_23]|nr:MAG: hypothetical protein AMS15_00260 [Planctomycetes bacterium DG_23]